MRITVLGGCGAWPAAGRACGGYLVTHDGFRLLIDPGYAVLPRLLELTTAAEIDAVLVSHGHPDHCADLNPLLRARTFVDDGPAPALPIHALPGALDAVLALDRPGVLPYGLRVFDMGEKFSIGPFQVEAFDLPHHMPNAGLRLTADGRALAYTGDTGPSPAIVDLARDADLFLAEATYPWRVPGDAARYLSSALQAGENASAAGAGRLMLTHLSPGTDAAPYVEAAARHYAGTIEVAEPGVVADLHGP